MALIYRAFPSEAEALAFQEGLHYHNDERIGVESVYEDKQAPEADRWVVEIFDATEGEE